MQRHTGGRPPARLMPRDKKPQSPKSAWSEDLLDEWLDNILTLMRHPAMLCMAAVWLFAIVWTGTNVMKRSRHRKRLRGRAVPLPIIVPNYCKAKPKMSNGIYGSPLSWFMPQKPPKAPDKPAGNLTHRDPRKSVYTPEEYCNFQQLADYLNVVVSWQQFENLLCDTDCVGRLKQYSKFLDVLMPYIVAQACMPQSHVMGDARIMH